MQAKKVLIITYYWPPSGGGGVQRWLKFIKYLPKQGWEPVVVVPENAEYPTADQSLLKDVDTNLELIRLPIWEPYHLFKIFTGKKKTDKVNTGFLFDDKKVGFKENLALWLRGNLLIPDPRVFWVNPTYRKLKKYLEKNPIETVITTGPPHSVHLIGLKLQKKFGLKWVADFRDPWSTIDYLEIFKLRKWAIKKQQKLERKVLQKANLVLAVSQHWEEELQSLGARNTAVVTNGFDGDDFQHYEKKDQAKFVFTYTGLITSLRNPMFLWELLEELLGENESFAAQFEFRLVGTIDKQVLDAIQHHSKLFERTRILNYLPHNEVLKVYGESTLLLLLLNQSHNALGHIPGKLFEYLASQTPILAIGEKNGDVAQILKETKAGEIFRNDEKAQIKQFILSQLSATHETTGIDQYSRENLTKDLAGHLSNL